VTSDGGTNENARGYHLYPLTDVVHAEQVHPFLHRTMSAIQYTISSTVVFLWSVKANRAVIKHSYQTYTQ